jgi:hypothetical protein
MKSTGNGIIALALTGDEMDGEMHGIGGERGELPQLADALRAIAGEDPGRVSAGVESHLMAEFRSSRRQRRPSRAAFGLGLAMAATLVAAIVVPVWRVMVRGELSSLAPPGSQGAPAPIARSTAATAFLPLMYSAVPAGDVQVIRLRVPRPALASFGLAPMEAGEAVSRAVSEVANDVAADGSTGTVLADVLVGEDGLARAVRFVRPQPGQLRPAPGAH